MLLQSLNPFISCEYMLAHFFRLSLLKPGICLRFDNSLKEVRINGANDSDKELAWWALLSLKIIRKVPLDITVVLYLVNESIHIELTVVGKTYTVDLIILKTGLIPSKKLANELAVNLMVGVKETLTIRKTVKNIKTLLTIMLSYTDK